MQYPSPFTPWRPGRSYQESEHPPEFDKIDKSFGPNPDQYDSFGDGVAVSDCCRTPDGNKYQWFCVASVYSQWQESIWYVGGSKADSFIWPHQANYYFDLGIIMYDGWARGEDSGHYEETTNTQGQMDIWFPNVFPFGAWEFVDNPLSGMSFPWEILTRFGAEFKADFETGWIFSADYELFVWTEKPKVGVGIATAITSLALLANRYRKRRG